MPDPQTGAGFDAPSPAEAYADAPPLLEESAALLRESTNLQCGHGAGDPARERDYLLRRAALADRLAIEAPGDEEFPREAVQTSQTLTAWDRAHPQHVRGPYGPSSIEWDPSARPYVRQEYAARSRNTQGAS